MARMTSRSVFIFRAIDTNTVKAMAPASGVIGGVGNPTLTAKSSMWAVSSTVRLVTIIANGPAIGG